MRTAFSAMRGYKGISILNVSPIPQERNLELFSLPSIICVNELEAAALTARRVPNIE